MVQIRETDSREVWGTVSPLEWGEEAAGAAFFLLGKAKAPGGLDLGGILPPWKYRGRRLFV